MNMSRLNHRSGTALIGLVALQILLVLASVQAGRGDGLAIAGLAGACALLLGGAAFASPARLILVSPLFLVIPIQILTFYPFEWLLMAGLGAAVLLRASDRRTLPKPTPTEILWTAYVIWAWVTVAHAANTYTALQAMSRVLIAGMAYVAGYRVIGARRTRALVTVMALLAPVITLHLIGNILAHGYTMDLITSRLGTVTDIGWGFSNYVAAVAALAAVCAIILLLFGSGLERVVGVLGIFGAVLVQAITLSRGGTLALLLGLALAGAVELRRRLVVVLLLTATVLAAFFLSPLGAAVIGRFSSTQGLLSIGARLLFFREAWSIWQAHWLTGVGPDQIPYHTPIYTGANPHNIILKQLADFGLIGFGLYLGIFGTLVATALKARLRVRTQEGRMMAVAMVITLGVALVNAQYEPTLGGNVYGFLFWMLIGSFKRHAEVALQAAPSVPA